MTSLGIDFDAGQNAFVDTAAVMINSDLIITSDTAVAHLAGALGCQTWVAQKHVPDWRWMLDRSDTVVSRDDFVPVKKTRGLGEIF